MSLNATSRDNLIRWLDGDWALQFSHPGDFACTDFEADRWLVVMRDAFSASGVRPIAAKNAETALGASWIPLVGGVLVRVDNLPQPQGLRVVTVLDDALTPRRQFIYELPQNAPSPLDLVSATWMLRNAPRTSGRPVAAGDTQREEQFIGQIWRTAREGLVGVVEQMDRHLVRSVRSGLQRGLQWIGQDPLTEEEELALRASRSINGGW